MKTIIECVFFYSSKQFNCSQCFWLIHLNVEAKIDCSCIVSCWFKSYRGIKNRQFTILKVVGFVAGGYEAPWLISDRQYWRNFNTNLSLFFLERREKVFYSPSAPLLGLFTFFFTSESWMCVPKEVFVSGFRANSCLEEMLFNTVSNPPREKL